MKFCENGCGKSIPPNRKYCSTSCAAIWRNKNNSLIKQLSKERLLLRNKSQKQIEYSIRNITRVNNDPELVIKRDIARDISNAKPENKEKYSTHAINNLKEINDHRKTHNGRTYYEEVLWQNRIFQMMNPKWSKRIYYGRKYYILDFYFPDVKLNIELDHYGSGNLSHNIELDKIRDEYLLSLGWFVMRFSNRELSDVDKVATKIHEVYYELLTKKEKENGIWCMEQEQLGLL